MSVLSVRHLPALLLATTFVVGVVEAQAPLGVMRRHATRAELESALAATDSAALQVSDAQARQRLAAAATSIRQRLRNGDFAPGDRLSLVVLGDTMLTDTFTVRQDQRLALPNIPELSLRGVLDSELSGFLTRELSRYLRDPRVTATGLVDVTVSGAVARPGFATVPADMRLTDVLMSLGGPSPMAQIDRAFARRGDKVLLDRKQFSEALRTGRTVGDVALRDGDEIVLPAQMAGGRWQIIVPVLSTVVGLLWMLRFNGGGSRVTP